MIYILLILILFIIYAGYCNAIMDLIVPQDLLAYKGRKWTYAAMIADKHGWWENTFPGDEWHTHKVKMILALGCAVVLGFVAGIVCEYTFTSYQLAGISAIGTLLVSFLFSASFSVVYNYTRKHGKLPFD